MIQNKIKSDDLNDCTKIQLEILSEKRKGERKLKCVKRVITKLLMIKML